MNSFKISLIDPNKLTFKMGNSLFLNLNKGYISIYNKYKKLNKYEREILINELNLIELLLNDLTGVLK